LLSTIWVPGAGAVAAVGAPVAAIASASAAEAAILVQTLLHIVICSSHINKNRF
jgi:hypothetical protein